LTPRIDLSLAVKDRLIQLSRPWRWLGLDPAKMGGVKNLDGGQSPDQASEEERLATELSSMNVPVSTPYLR
jgi:hypothetical protein